MATLAFIFLKFNRSKGIQTHFLEGKNLELGVVLGVVFSVLTLFLFVEWPYIFVRVAEETSLQRAMGDTR